MKSLLKYVAAVVLCAGLIAPDALAIEVVPHNINIQGVLRNVAGDVVTGTYSMKFSLYDAGTGGTVLCQNISNLTVTGGVFNTSVTCLASAFINRTAVWLGITVGADAELERVPLASVGFAIQAEHAEQADELLGAARDVDCTGCVGDTEVSFNYASSDSKAGPANGLVCAGCVSGGTGATSDIAAATITSDNIGAGQVATGNIAAGAVTNAKLGADAVKTGNIEDYQVTTNDLANGLLTSAKFGVNSVPESAIIPLYALGDAKSGNAKGLNCSPACVSAAEVSFTFAASGTQGGPASNVDCLAITGGCIEAGEVSFNYAASGTKGGAASDLNCTNCVASGEVEFNYAGSASEGGPASDLSCANCVALEEVGFNYAGSLTKGGAASKVECTGADAPCISTGEVDFYWAASATKGGAANDLICTTCVQTTDLDTASVTDVKVASGIAGSKITQASATAFGTVKTGLGITATGGIITPDWNEVATKTHAHTSYFANGTDNLSIGDGKYIDFVDPGDNPGSYAARLSEASAASGGDAVLRASLGVASATPRGSFFEVYAEGGIVGSKHKLYAGGDAWHAGNLQIDGTLSCSGTGCVDSADITNESITGTDILNGSVTGADLDPALALTTTGKITAGEVWATKFVDSNASGYFADPNAESNMKDIKFDNLKLGTNTVYGLMNNGTSTPLSLYTSTIDAGQGGEILYIQKNKCGLIDVYGGSACAQNIMTVHGTVKASLFYDADGAYYVDPNSHSLIKSLKTDTVEIPRTGTTTNFISGVTTTFDVPWKDAQGGDYQVDPSGDTKLNVLYANGVRLNTSWPGDPTSGSAQVANLSHNLVLSPDAIGGGQFVYMRYNGANRFSFGTAGGADINVPGFRTDGGYLVMNSGVSSKQIYMNWDFGGGTVNINGDLNAARLLDQSALGCVMDPGADSATWHIYSAYMSAHYMRVHQGLRVDGTGIFVVGNGDWGTGIRMNGNTSIMPVGDAAGMIGSSYHRFYYMHAVQFFGAFYAGISNREAKKDIKYLNNTDMESIGNAIQQIKPTTWLYKEEVMAGKVPEGTKEAYIRNVPHVGAILDEMPALISNGGATWFLNDSVGFLLVASKYLDDKINKQAGQLRDLEDRLAILEQAVVDAGLYN
jgi:hypothetical protein